MKYRRIIQAFQSTPWAILPSKLQEIITFLELKSASGNVSEAEIHEFFDEDERDTRPEPPAPQSIAVIPIHGVLARRMNMMTRASGGTSLAAVSKTLREATASDSVKAIILDVDSPGGEVMGITELHAEILKARRKKPVVAHVSGIAASAAYHLASAAQDIAATPSAMLGSIGVIGVHIDESKAMENAGLGVTLKTAGKFKADASGLVPLSEEGEEELQRRVDESYAIMIRDIAKGRGLSVSRVRKDFGDARVVESKLALELGMIDRVETFEATLARVGGGPGTSTGTSTRATGGSDIIAGDDIVSRETMPPEPEVIVDLVEGVVPQNVSDRIAPDDTAFSKPTLADFTDEPWSELSDSEKRKIAGHYAWSPKAIPDAFGDLKLPHHRASDGWIVPNGVRNALSRLPQTKGIPSEDKSRVESHLNAHMEKIRARNDEERDGAIAFRERTRVEAEAHTQRVLQREHLT